MKENAFSDILFNWSMMKESKKKQRVQDLENMLARKQGRRARKITFGKDHELLEIVGEERTPGALYWRESDRFHIFDLNCDSYEIIKNIIHEGIHAYIGDAINGDATLKLYSNFDKERFLIEEENLSAISYYFRSKDMMPLFDSYFIEERLNYKEDSIISMTLLFDLIENISDAQKLLTYIIYSVAMYCDNEFRGKSFELEFDTTYDRMVFEALNNSTNFEKVDMSKVRIIKKENNEQFMQFFDSEIKNYMDYANLVKSNVLSPIAKKIEMEKIVQQITNEYVKYVKSNILAKRKY